MKTIDNKQYNSCKAILLPTGKSRLSKYIPQNTLSFAEGVHFGIPDSMIPQHLYITDDSEIKEGDWVYHNLLKQVFQINLKEVSKEYIIEARNIKKIIATTNPELNDITYQEVNTENAKGIIMRDGLPKPSEEFIKQWVNNPQEDVLIEVEHLSVSNEELEYDKPSGYYKIKTSPDNTVNLRFVEKETDLFEELLQTIESKSINNTAIITNVKLFVESWRKEREMFNPPKRKK